MEVQGRAADFLKQLYFLRLQAAGFFYFKLMEDDGSYLFISRVHRQQRVESYIHEYYITSTVYIDIRYIKLLKRLKSNCHFKKLLTCSKVLISGCPNAKTLIILGNKETVVICGALCPICPHTALFTFKKELNRAITAEGAQLSVSVHSFQQSACTWIPIDQNG